MVIKIIDNQFTIDDYHDRGTIKSSGDGVFYCQFRTNKKTLLATSRADLLQKICNYIYKYGTNKKEFYDNRPLKKIQLLSSNWNVIKEWDSAKEANEELKYKYVHSVREKCRNNRLMLYRENEEFNNCRLRYKED